MGNNLPLSNEYFYPNVYNYNNYGAANSGLGQDFYAPQVLSFGNSPIQNDSFIQSNQKDSSEPQKSSNNGIIILATLAIAATLGFVFKKDIANFFKGEKKAASNLNKNPLNTASSDAAASNVQAPPAPSAPSVPATSSIASVVPKADVPPRVSKPAVTTSSPQTTLIQPPVSPKASVSAEPAAKPTVQPPVQPPVKTPTKVESNTTELPKITDISKIKKSLQDAGFNKKLIDVLTEEQAEFISRFGMHDAQFKTVLTSGKLDKDLIEYIQASIDDSLLGVGYKKAGSAIPQNDAIKLGLAELQQKTDNFIAEVKSNQNLKDELKFLRYKNLGVAFRRMLAENDARFARNKSITGAFSIPDGEEEMVKILQARPELKDKIISRAALDHGLDAAFNGITDYQCKSNSIQELLKALDLKA